MMLGATTFTSDAHGGSNDVTFFGSWSVNGATATSASGTSVSSLTTNAQDQIARQTRLIAKGARVVIDNTAV